ncbi:hypothetical protein A4X06_0g343 [Tilletia controversa]|uniref:Zn(2)-C6 fungal-type domain-containing protein n=1 Tax=Tilletia controversa TaxID=13291 RepID=A0A8X7N0A4_9BASI|nr:hypothetical protein CF328_g201 [Tilletia controversa]KAE8255620.1 hypothetical protein A4X06_0g343 [Tilletia controversa]
MADQHNISGGSSGGGGGGGGGGGPHRDHLQQLQHSHFHHPFPSTHHPYLYSQQHQQAAHHPTLGFLPPDHLPDPHQSPAPVSVHHPGFPPPAQPSFFSPSPHQVPQFHHHQQAHIYHHQQAPQHQHHEGPPPGSHSHPAQQMEQGFGSGMPQGMPGGGSSPTAVGGEMLNFPPNMHGNFGAPSVMHTAGALAPESALESSPDSARARKKLGAQFNGRRTQAIMGAPQTANSVEFSAGQPGMTPLQPPPLGFSSAPPSEKHAPMHNANVPTRKQNQSCDNCRRRKIACRPPAPHVDNPHRRCAHCLNKNADCTHNYVNRVQGAKLAGEVERPGSSAKKPRNGDAQIANPAMRRAGQLRQRSSSSTAQIAGPRSSDDDDEEEESEADDEDDLEGSEGGKARLAPGARDESPATSVETGPGHKRKRSQPESVKRAKISHPPAASASEHDPHASGSGPRLHPTAQLIRYLLSPSDTTPFPSADTMYPSSAAAAASTASASYFPTPLRLPIPTRSARRVATDAQLRSEVLHDFVESFLAIVNPRFALLDARRVRAGIYPFEELVLEDADDRAGSSGASETRFGKKTRRRRYRHAEEYLYRSDTDGEQDDGGLPSCAPATRQQRDQHVAPATRHHADGKSTDLKAAGATSTSASSSLRPRPLPDVLIAVVLAFGAKFSSHEILVADRAESATYLTKAWDICKADARARQSKSGSIAYGSSEEDEDEDEEEEDGVDEYAMEPSILCSGRSSITKNLLIKAQDVLEKRRAFALPTLTNVQAALLMEPLFDQGVRLDEHKKGTPKWEMLAELLQQFDRGTTEEGATGTTDASVSHWRPQHASVGPLWAQDAKTRRRLLRTAAALSARSRGSDNSGSQPSLDFCGFWHSVALRHLLELRLHEADYVATLCDIDILSARRPDFFGESELERKMLEEELRTSVDAERAKMDVGEKGDAGGVGGTGKAMVSYKLNALDAAIGATNSLGTLAQSAWWMASTSDAITSAFFRKRPLMRPEEMLGAEVLQSEVETDGEESPVNESAGAGAMDGTKMENGQTGPLRQNGAPVGPASSESRGAIAAQPSQSDSGGEASDNRSRSQSLAQRSGRTSHASGGTGAANQRRLRRLNTGGITREAGPDPYEGSEEDGSASASQLLTAGDGNELERRLAAASVRSVSSNSILSNEDGGTLNLEVSALSAPTTTTSTGPPSAGPEPRANPEKLALLGERVSLPKKDSYQIWYTGISELCKIHRLMWDTLWSPRARAQGVRLHPLRNIQRRTEKWRRTYLPKLGVPYDRADDGQGQGPGQSGSSSEVASWPQEWDFIAASTANMLSINSFALDILMWQAVEDHGIAEAREMENEMEEGDEDGTGTPLNSAPAGAGGGGKARLGVLGKRRNSADSRKGRGSLLPPTTTTGAGGESMDVEELTPAARAERSVCNNALAASLRIAALVEVLRANYYLRLDPNILHFTIHAAGQFLVTYDNPAVYSIIEGLKQYGLSYEEGLEQADQLAAYASAAGIPRLPTSSPSTTGAGIGITPAPAPAAAGPMFASADEADDESLVALLASSKPVLEQNGQSNVNGVTAALSADPQLPVRRALPT